MVKSSGLKAIVWTKKPFIVKVQPGHYAKQSPFIFHNSKSSHIKA